MVPFPSFQNIIPMLFWDSYGSCMAAVWVAGGPTNYWRSPWIFSWCTEIFSLPEAFPPKNLSVHFEPGFYHEKPIKHFDWCQTFIFKNWSIYHPADLTRYTELIQEKKHFYFPWSTGCLIGILMSCFILIPTRPGPGCSSPIYPCSKGWTSTVGWKKVGWKGHESITNPNTALL